METHIADTEIDARSTFCPGPLMELIMGLRKAAPGATIAVLSDDDGATADLPPWIERAGHELLAVEVLDCHTRFVVRKAR